MDKACEDYVERDVLWMGKEMGKGVMNEVGYRNASTYKEMKKCWICLFFLHLNSMPSKLNIIRMHFFSRNSNYLIRYKYIFSL